MLIEFIHFIYEMQWPFKYYFEAFVIVVVAKKMIKQLYDFTSKNNMKSIE